MTHATRATAALQALAEADPALAALSLWCHHRNTDHGNTPAWTGGATIHYTPRFATLPPDQQQGLAAHQILHAAFRHAQRAQALRARLGDSFDEHLFALACDAILNQMLGLAGYTQPRPHVLLTELLEASFGDKTDPQTALGANDAEALYTRLTQSNRGPGQDPAVRARTYAKARDFEPDLDSTTAAPEAAGSPEAADWRQHLTRALEAGRAAGRGLGLLQPFLADQPKPRTPWETLLRGIVTKAVTPRPRLSHARPGRHWLALDAAARAAQAPDPAFLPGLTRDARIPRIALCLDASSSIPDALLSRFQAQIASIGKRTGAELHVLVFDEQVRCHDIADPARPRRPDMPRGGGTCYRDVTAKAAALDPSIIVVLTDLDAPLPPNPKRPVLWAVPDASRVALPRFGSLISLAD
ncbi:MAG: VWA-like domain-containing protein [Rhodobacter sp.]|nr:VWA-like domain-containing protein [Rhodobacter sp.]